jgi:hypothetical protein
MADYPSPPITIPAGQFLVWLLPGGNVSVATVSSLGTAESTQTTSTLTQTGQAGLGSPQAAETTTWSDFTLSLPHSSTLKSVYAVTVLSFNCPNTVIKSTFGSTILINTLQTSKPSTQYSEYVGDTEGVITSNSLVTELSSTEPGQRFPQNNIITTFSGLAVYATIPTARTVAHITVGNTFTYPRT